MFGRLFAATVWLVLSACDKAPVDVLEEFPPPRLAREVAAQGSSPRPVAARCAATWRLFGRKARESHHLRGEGTFEVRGEPPVPVAGTITFDPERASPRLPRAVQSALQSRDQQTPWTWRLLQVGDAPADLLGMNEGASPLAQATSETQLNAVRTRQSHSLERNAGKGTSRGVTFETQLRVDLAAHHVTGLTLPDDSPPRRSDLLIECELSTDSDDDSAP